MTKQDAFELLRMNFILYPQSKELSPAELDKLATIWAFHFKEYPADTIKRAFLAANKVCRFAIQPADIFAELDKQKDPGADWEKLKAALPEVVKLESWRRYPAIVGEDASGRLIKSNGTAELKTLFESLPASVQAFVGSPSGLTTLTKQSEADLDRYTRSVFMRQAPEAMPPALPAGAGRMIEEAGRE